MKYSDRFLVRSVSLLTAAVLLLSGCGNLSYSAKYQPSGNGGGLSSLFAGGGDRAAGYAANLCIAPTTDFGEAGAGIADCAAAVLFNTQTLETVYCKNAYERVNPASITKVMTALVAIKYGSPDQMLTVTSNCLVNEYGAQLAGLKVGEKMSLDQALRILLMYSANDVANLIAEGVGGSIEGFVDMMNKEAAAIGATATHFTNPHGLTDENHYTTPYDIYLMFNEALKYETFIEIISQPSFEAVYYNKSGNQVSMSVKNTNGYFSGGRVAPQGVTVVGGKTGSTSAAGHCLVLLAKSPAGTPYIAIVMRAQDNDKLYGCMNELLCLMQ